MTKTILPSDAIIVKHKKRGSTYEILGIGKMQTEFAKDGIDMAEVVVYKSMSDGSFWVRPVDDFNDGRFEIVNATLKSIDRFDRQVAKYAELRSEAQNLVDESYRIHSTRPWPLKYMAPHGAIARLGGLLLRLNGSNIPATKGK